MMALTKTVTLSLVRIWAERSVMTRGSSNLLGWHVVGLGPHVDLLVGVHAGKYKENTGTSSATGEEAPQAEDDSALVLLGEDVGVGSSGHLPGLL